mmetsp:Transcript_18340/g.18594  ORF Transcript_18340/g.18594 Transcript_18340/m.18594 type:complete len:245 (-) Transcript_18340:541-1275(-)
MKSAITPMKPPRRGAFILLEGVDRCGKTTQCGLLIKHLLALSLSAVAMNFPDRTTHVGTIINSYLKSGNEMNDQAIHLLFSANRWENAPRLTQCISDGNAVVCDRYAYSGVAFSSAKIQPNGDNILSIDWCKNPDIGLPAPDAVIFLDVSQEEAEQRGGYGNERYEKRDMQVRVRERFSQLQAIDEKDGRVPWYIIDASESIDKVETAIQKITHEILQKVNAGAPMRKMWEDGDYELPPQSENI